MEPFGTSSFASALVSRGVVVCLIQDTRKCKRWFSAPQQGSAWEWEISRRTSRYSFCYLDMWIVECVLLNESIPRPGQVQEIVHADSYCVVFCVKLALSHLHYLRLVLIQVQGWPRCLSLIEPPGYTTCFFIWFTIDFDRSAPWYTCFTNRFMVYVDICEITSRFLFSFSRLITQTKAGVFLWG